MDVIDRDNQQLGGGISALLLTVGALTLVVGLLLFVVPGEAGVGSAGRGGSPAGDQWWPWPLRTDLITRFFGALFVSVGVGALWGARQTTWGQVRALFPPGLAFTALATAAALLHTDSFDEERIATWAFFALYVAVLIAATATFLKYERGGSYLPDRRTP